MRVYKGTLVGKGSALDEALKQSSGAEAAAKKVYAETSERYCALYSAEDRAWFANWRTNGVAPNAQVS